MDELKDTSDQLERYTMELKTLNKTISKSRTQLDLKQKKLKAIKRNIESKQKTLAKLRNAYKEGVCKFFSFQLFSHINYDRRGDLNRFDVDTSNAEQPKAGDKSFGGFQIVVSHPKTDLTFSKRCNAIADPFM